MERTVFTSRSSDYSPSIERSQRTTKYTDYSTERNFTSDYSPTRERTSSYSRLSSKPPLNISTTTTTRRHREVPRSYSYRSGDMTPPLVSPLSPTSPLSPSYTRSTSLRGASMSPETTRRHMVRIRGYQTFAADENPVDITDYSNSDTGGYVVTTNDFTPKVRGYTESSASYSTDYPTSPDTSGFSYSSSRYRASSDYGDVDLSDNLYSSAKVVPPTPACLCMKLPCTL